MKTSMACLILLTLLWSCDSRRPAEEGEAFLDETKQRLTTTYNLNAENTEEKSIQLRTAIRLDLLSAERKYRFTDRQLIRLKLLILSNYNSITGPQRDRFCEEVERLALATGDDSLVLQTRTLLLVKHIRLRDTLHAEQMLQRIEPALLQQSPQKLKGFIVGISQIYADLRQPAGHARWVERLRLYEPPSQFAHYHQVALGYMRLNNYRQALAYADTALSLQLRPNVASAHLVRATCLERLGRIEEALDWDERCVSDIRDFQQEKGIKTVSVCQAQLLYEYATLLRRMGKPREALPPLDRLEEKVHLSWSSLPTTRHEDEGLFPVQVARLRSECYKDMGNLREAMHQSQAADSLQTVLNFEQRKVRMEHTSELYRNEQLLAQLSWKEEEEAQAQIIQYLLASAVVILAAIILAGALWWRSRRKRLRQLFDMLIIRHAAWLQIHRPYPLPPSPGNLPAWEEAEEVIAAENTASSTPQHLDRLYRRVSRVMLEECPYLDPNLDLVTLASLAGTNRTNLSTALNRETGMNFSRWLAEYRVNHLIALSTLQPDRDLADLAADAGFTSRASFFRQFRQVTGLTPNQYKNERKQTSE